MVKEILDGVESTSSGGIVASGDMTKAVFDPTNINDDAFDMDNMVEGTAKILTAAERTAISNIGAPRIYAHYTKSAAQNLGGANGTVHYVDWDGTEIHEDTGFTHDTVTNSSRITVTDTGRYEIKANVSITQGGSARTTYMSGLRVNGTTANTLGRQRNYSRGSGYGDTSTGLCTEIDLTSGDYIEMSITIDDADSSYTSNSISAECEFIIRRLD